MRSDKNPTEKQKTDFPRCGTPRASHVRASGSGIGFMLSEYLLNTFKLLAQPELTHEGKTSATAHRTAMICWASWPDQLRYAS
ncbi:hypothetical protein QCM77_26300 [Bradyrhizobium sp. SSUT18]|uniref:hypothetical protein n=1 Tax=unclassified Bradyrhizobium TaxID=2631580 RepID=UPI002446CC0A|nr:MULTISPECIES: hypothetical protein [unclassified Bradyrhizobium]MDH2347584.1 hypothetical protein [Bradyrhizobium sp. SSUT77]MDH2403436.1 hypothetical protein [Bradyrhizobium sp. SSUT18]